jgi:hypothetical protein
VLESVRIKPAGEAMENSVSNIQLTPEAKRMIEGEIAYQTSGQGFWIGVVMSWVFIVVSGLLLLTGIGFCLYGALRGNLWGLAWAIFLGFMVYLIPVSGIGTVRRAIKNRRG